MALTETTKAVGNLSCELRGEFSTRFQEARTILGKSQQAMATALGVSVGAIQSYEGGKSVPGGNVLQALAALGFNSEWLLLGNGSMKRGEGGVLPPPGSDAYVYLPLYNVTVSAGHGALPPRAEVADWLAFKREWISNELRASTSNLSLLFVDGDSMEPTLYSGDVVMIEKVDGGRMGDGLYVLRADNVLKVKRLQFRAGREVEVLSDNPRYRPETFRLDDLSSGIEVVGRVVWAGRKF